MTAMRVHPRGAFPDGREFPRSRTPVRPGPETRRGDGASGLADVLGWFSIGLGLTALLAPRGVARFIGARGDDDDQTLLRLVGVQELACGVGILSSRRPAGWLWARTAGDALHLGLLSGALASGPPEPGRMAAATAAIAGIGVVDALNAIQLTRHPAPPTRAARLGPIDVHQAITIDRPAGELYRFWRDFRNLPRIMSHLESVETTDDTHSRWKAHGPAGMPVEWDAEIVEDHPDHLIAWRTVGGWIRGAGQVRFAPAPGGRGTEVHVMMQINPPAGRLGHWVAMLFGASPEQTVFNDLRHFKQVMETGEVVRSDASLDGSWMMQRPAQPFDSPPPR